MEKKKKILLVDDEVDFCFFAKNNLEQSGEFEVITSNCGEEGINLARSEKPDLILLDIAMPKVSGPDIVEVLRSDVHTKHIPFIFLTAVVTEQEIGAAPMREIGGYNFVAKPVDTERLIESINKMLAKASEV